MKINWSDILDITECLFGKYDNFNLLTVSFTDMHSSIIEIDNYVGQCD